MTPRERKRLERLRRKEAGEVRVEVWLEPHQIKRLDYLCDKEGIDRAEGLRRMVGRYGSPPVACRVDPWFACA